MSSKNIPAKKTAKVKRDPAADTASSSAKAKTKADLKKDAKAKLSKGAKIVLVIIGCAAMLLSVSAMACSGLFNEVSGANKSDYELTGGVAGTVNGVNITEDTITKQIMSARTSAGKDKDKDWAQYLVDQGLTPESYRENMIRSYASQYLLTEAEKEYNIEVTDADIQEAWDDAVKSYGGGDESKFESFLKQVGYTKDTYKESLKSSVSQKKLKEAVAPEKKVTDDDVIEYLNKNLSTYNDAKRSSHILIKVDSKASDKDKEKAEKKAQEALDKINSGEMSFEDAAKKYSEDTSKDKGGDVGWDKLTTFVTEYQDALNKLNKDQISGVVKSSYGYHVIKCTDVFHVDDKVTSIDQVPSEIKDYITNQIKTNQVSTDYNKWLQDYTDKADIKINKMPKDLPYNVSLDGVKPSSQSGSNGSSSK